MANEDDSVANLALMASRLGQFTPQHLDSVVARMAEEQRARQYLRERALSGEVNAVDVQELIDAGEMLKTLMDEEGLRIHLGKFELKAYPTGQVSGYPRQPTVYYMRRVVITNKYMTLYESVRWSRNLAEALRAIGLEFTTEIDND